MTQREERIKLAVILAQYIVDNIKPEYGVLTVSEECSLSGPHLMTAAVELAEANIIEINHGWVLSDIGFISFRLKRNGEANAKVYIEMKRKIGQMNQVVTLNALESSSVGQSLKGESMQSIYSIVGSPYGFTQVDWELIQKKKSDPNTIHITLGYQFVSEYYTSTDLITNLRTSLQKATDRYNEINPSARIHLNFRDLKSGLGEHLFNEIAREILSSDITILETSDLNPNVMIELGIALTCGVSVIPIREEKAPNPPSDISGQTWKMYKDSAKIFVPNNDDGSEEFKNLFDRVMRLKRSKM